MDTDTDQNKPQKMLADYVVVAISPLLIMLIVGSLCFFLIQVFYRGEMVVGVRWTMFWFVLAIVLVSRIGIQLGKWHARIYGTALAVATWVYLAYTHKLPILGAILLAVTWWCAHWLTVDCTLVRGDESAGGMWQNLWRSLEEQFAPRDLMPNLPNMSPEERKAVAELIRRRPPKQAKPPGRSVVFFSLAALPLFGIGQLFLPADDPHARHVGFMFLAIYLGAAFCLLATTSFLGVRQQLRRHALEMPASVTAAWLKFGVLLTAGVLLLALLLPRPGAMSFWKYLAYTIPHKQHKASNYAPPFNPPGQGEGRPTEQPVQRNEPGMDSKRAAGTGTGDTHNDSPSRSNSRTPSDQTGSDGQGGGAGGKGNSGTGGGNSGDNPSPGPITIKLKDVTPQGNADQPSENTKPDNSGGSEPDKEGKVPEGNKQPLKIEQPQQPSKPGKITQPKEAKQPKQIQIQPKPVKQPEPPPPQQQGTGPKQPSDWLNRLLRALLILALVVVVIWLLIYFRKAIARVIRTAANAVANFFRKLFRIRRRRPSQDGETPAPDALPDWTAPSINPFVTGKDKLWTPEHLVRYTYEHLQSWAKEQGIEMPPQQTPREFCSRLIEHFPDIGPELEQFSTYYSHTAFAKRLPDDFETESLRRIWQYLDESVLVAGR
jgi:hypothetical protein